MIITDIERKELLREITIARAKIGSIVSNMENKYVVKSKEIIEEVAGDILNVEQYSHYLWIYRNDGEMIGIVHGGIDKPFEFKLINIGDIKQKDFHSTNWNSFQDFLRYEMRDIILAMAI